MKAETLKEIGKFGFDIAKIIFAVTILPILMKNGEINWFGIIGAFFFFLGGVFLINKGVKDE
ncbi:MAG: hypothetical protein GXO62_05785 [Epsilonproteobacteria bacterium]|nr:hypothetical protein [Campylobacterota bacterium]